MKLGRVFLTAVTLILSASSLFVSGPAAADSMANLKTIDLNVHGTIGQHCAMGTIGNMSFGDITRPNLRIATRVSFDCNVPFTVTIKAQNGALTNNAYPHGQGPYSGTLPYRIGIDLPLRRPDRTQIERTFESRELTGGRTISSEGGIAVDGMALDVALGRPSGEAGLLAGNYGETIEITVAPT